MNRKVVCAALWLCWFPSSLWEQSNAATRHPVNPAETETLEQRTTEKEPPHDFINDKPRRYAAQRPSRRQRITYLQNFESLAANPTKPATLTQPNLPTGMTLISRDAANEVPITNGRYAAKGQIPIPLNPADKAVFKNAAGRFTVRFTAYSPSGTDTLQIGADRFPLNQAEPAGNMRITALAENWYQIEHEVTTMDNYVIQSGNTIVDEITVRSQRPQRNSESLYAYHPVFAK